VLWMDVDELIRRLERVEAELRKIEYDLDEAFSEIRRLERIISEIRPRNVLVW